jgi:hypothetical protein
VWILLVVITYVNVVKERLIDQADKRVPFMLRPAFKRELPAYCSPVVTGAAVWSVAITRCSRAVLPHSGVIFRLSQ